jgi:hypothetical protein
VTGSVLVAGDPDEGFEACTIQTLSLWPGNGLPFAHW